MAWIIYRDRDTGRFVKEQVWKRAKKRGSKRYKKQKVKRKKRPPKPPPLPPPQGPVYEWIISMSYKKSNRSFDVIVTARNEAEAYDVTRNFLRDDTQGRRIVQAGFHGWELIPVKGALTEEGPGEAGYRDKSKRRKH